MQKIIFSLVCVLGLCSVVPAQIIKNNVLLSTTGNVNSSKSDISTNTAKFTSLSYSLTSHYLLSNHLGLGVWVNGSKSSGNSKINTNTFGISGRYFLNIGKRWNFYSGLNLGYLIGKVETPYAIGVTEANLNGFVQNIQVGLLFKIAKRWNIDVNSTLASFNQTTTTIKNGSEIIKNSSSFQFAPDGLLSGTRVGICFLFGKMAEPISEQPIKE